jgi:hypothetical protein
MSSRTSTPGEKDQASGTKSVFAESRYVSVFQCSHRMTLHAATLDGEGRNLPTNPSQGGKWTMSRQIVVGPDQANRPGIDMVALKAGIEQNGFYLWNTEMEPAPEPLRLMR